MGEAGKPGGGLTKDNKKYKKNKYYINYFFKFT